MSPVDRARLAAALDQVTYQSGRGRLQTGELADALYILREGWSSASPTAFASRFIEHRAVFGDLALRATSPRATTLRAVTRVPRLDACKATVHRVLKGPRASPRFSPPR